MEEDSQVEAMLFQKHCPAIFFPDFHDLLQIRTRNVKKLPLNFAASIKMPENITGAAVSVSYKRDFTPFAFFDQRDRIIFTTNCI